MPIIGINESGKTTILHAIFAFDYVNDDQNEDGRHLNDVENLYLTSRPVPEVAAEVELSVEELKYAIAKAQKESEPLKGELVKIWRQDDLPTKIVITRNLKTKKYGIESDKLGSSATQNLIARKLILQLPYILYFDDFRDKIPGKIEVTEALKDSSSGWLAIVEQLFKYTDESYSVFALAGLEDRQRKSVISKVERKLNETLTREWQRFKLDEREALRISLEFERERVTGQTESNVLQSTPVASQAGTVNTTPPTGISERHYLKLEVVEIDGSGDQHFFFISDRSKGFYWFFNFVMKLEFNPKLVGGETDAIYLLDEPGSYLHAFAQRRLCQKLRQISQKNWVAYCTHSHYLLDPETIPVNSIMVAEKDSNGAIKLTPLTNYQALGRDKRSALQPVLDALQIKPFALDLLSPQTTVITEGIYDYFALKLFYTNSKISILPSVGADSIKYFISLLIAWGIDFRALWDNDPEGRRKFKEAAGYFGPEIERLNLRLLPGGSRGGRRIMQSLFDGQDLARLREELGLANNCSFERTLHALFYSARKNELVACMSQATARNFDELMRTVLS
jgi:hypothetical protein